MCVPREKPPTMATAITLQVKFDGWSLAWQFGTGIEHLLPSVPNSLVGLSQNHKEIQNEEMVYKILLRLISILSDSAAPPCPKTV